MELESGKLMPMPFVVQAHTAHGDYRDRALQELRRFTDISISDDIKTYSLDAFSLAMAPLEIGKTLEATAEKAKAIDAAN
jgi:hypothetical protein